jgi:hypothetical protein
MIDPRDVDPIEVYCRVAERLYEVLSSLTNGAGQVVVIEPEQVEKLRRLAKVMDLLVEASCEP